jgi:predicted nucleic acid-binding Zn finger protein
MNINNLVSKGKSEFVINLEKAVDYTKYSKVMGYRPDLPVILYKSQEKPIDKV